MSTVNFIEGGKDASLTFSLALLSMVPFLKVHILRAGALTLLNLLRRQRHCLQMLLQKMDISPKLIKITFFFSDPWGINLVCVCPLQGKETQNQSSKESRAAPHQSNDHSAAAKSTKSVSKHACFRNESSTSTDMLGNGTGFTLDSHNDHKTGLCVRNCHTPVGKPTGSGYAANLTLNLGHYNNEEKQDQSKDEALPELRQEEGCECKCELVLWWPITFQFFWTSAVATVFEWRCWVDVIFFSALEPMVDLQYVKNDSYEKGTDLMVVNVYMKGISRDTARVLFREQDFTLFFQTRYWSIMMIDWYNISLFMPLEPFIDSHCVIFLVVLSSDGNFLRLHSDCGPNTHFKWQVKLR